MFDTMQGCSRAGATIVDTCCSDTHDCHGDQCKGKLSYCPLPRAPHSQPLCIMHQGLPPDCDMSCDTCSTLAVILDTEKLWVSLNYVVGAWCLTDCHLMSQGDCLHQIQCTALLYRTPNKAVNKYSWSPGLMYPCLKLLDDQSSEHSSPNSYFHKLFLEASVLASLGYR